ncbi:MAG: glycosyltransferase family 4 protein, partial [Planctomycetales bacterium]|nr:glycosyltransferase family 4 protein [Planctomycetales bacterium]
MEPTPNEFDARPSLDKRVVLVTGFIPPYMLPVYHEIHRRLKDFTILVSTPMEGNRHWPAEWGQLNVQLQRTWTHRSRWRHQAGFADRHETHIPWDTLWRLRQLRPEILVSEELGFRSLLCAAYQRFHRRVPLVLACNLSEHTEQGRGRLRLALRRWLLARSRVVTVNGRSGCRYLRQLGVPAERIFPFPYVALPGVFDTLPLHRPVSAQRLVVCGELSERKGMRQLLPILEKWSLKHPQRTLTVIFLGSGPLLEELSQRATAPNLRLEFRGHCDYPKLRQELSAATFLVFPTLADEWGLVVNEALAAGLPVLGSRYSQAVEEL